MSSTSNCVYVRLRVNVLKSNSGSRRYRIYWKSLPTEFAEDSLYDPPSADGTKTVNIVKSSLQVSLMNCRLSNEIYDVFRYLNKFS